MTHDIFTAPLGRELQRFDGETAFHAYEAARRHYPDAAFPEASMACADLGALAALYDLFVFDAFGVLNVGETAIPGAVERVRRLQAAGKTCVILSNAASYDGEAARRKFERLGFSFPPSHIVTSREAALHHLALEDERKNWAVLGLHGEEAGALSFPPTFPEDRSGFDCAEGFLFLSTLRWTTRLQAELEASLAARSRPVVIANPDIIAPREGGLSTEPGFFGYRLAALGLGRVEFYGKPFPAIYRMVRARFADVAPSRICMIGDTLHTDILGAAAAGWKTALATAHGLLKGTDPTLPIARSGIVPDHILPSI